MKTVWKSIPGYEGHYEVSNTGQVRSLKTDQNKILRKRIKRGYEVVNLYRLGLKLTTYSVHRLVASAFVPNPNSQPMVNHLDNDKTNNIATNLEWTDNRGNQHNRLEKKTGKTTSKYYGVSKATNGWAAYIQIEKNRIKTFFENEIEAAEWYDAQLMALGLSPVNFPVD